MEPPIEPYVALWQLVLEAEPIELKGDAEGAWLRYLVAGLPVFEKYSEVVPETDEAPALVRPILNIEEEVMNWLIRPPYTSFFDAVLPDAVPFAKKGADLSILLTEEQLDVSRARGSSLDSVLREHDLNRENRQTLRAARALGISLETAWAGIHAGLPPEYLLTLGDS